VLHIDPMKLMKIGGYAGVVAVIVFVLCVYLSIAQFPGTLDSYRNDDLGSRLSNPTGAAIFNIGSAVTGILLIPFFLSIRSWRAGDTIVRKTFDVAVILGLAVSACLFMSAVLPAEWGIVHSLIGVVSRLSMLAFLVTADALLVYNPRFNRGIAYYSIAVIVAGLAVPALLVMNLNAAIADWMVVFGTMVWILLFSFGALSFETVQKPASVGRMTVNHKRL
jgi:hypothetical protein